MPEDRYLSEYEVKYHLFYYPNFAKFWSKICSELILQNSAAQYFVKLRGGSELRLEESSKLGLLEAGTSIPTRGCGEIGIHASFRN